MIDPSSWPVKPVEPLKWLNDRIDARLPACYVRFNDGEAYSMFGLKRAPESNGEHVYSDRMRRSLLRTFVDVCCRSAEDESVLVGSWWMEDCNHPAANAMEGILLKTGLIEEVRWGRGHIWHREEGGCPNDELLRFVRRLKTGYRPYPRTLFGNLSLRPVADALGMQFGEVDRTDAGERSIGVKHPLRQGELEIWCAGFPAKEWMWDQYVKGDVKYVVDAGSLFDGLVGNVSREWLRPGLPHSDWYYDEFRKAVFG